jgi:hypothetical protein
MGYFKHAKLQAAVKADSKALEQDHQLGHALTQVQLGRWEDVSLSLTKINRFHAEVYDCAMRAGVPHGVPPDHIHGKAQLVIEEWLNCMKQLNRYCMTNIVKT